MGVHAETISAPSSHCELGPNSGAPFVQFSQMTFLHSTTMGGYTSNSTSSRVALGTMSRKEESQKWEKHRNLIIFLYRFHDLGRTIDLLENSCDFYAG